MNLTEVFERKFNVLQNCPHHVRGRFRHASRQALEARSDAVHNDVGENRAWKLFCLLLFLLRGGRNERVSKAELCHRFDMFGVGEWEICSMKPLFPHQRCHYKLTARVRRIQWNRERRWRFRRFRWGRSRGPDNV